MFINKHWRTNIQIDLLVHAGGDVEMSSTGKYLITNLDIYPLSVNQSATRVYMKFFWNVLSKKNYYYFSSDFANKFTVRTYPKYLRILQYTLYLR